MPHTVLEHSYDPEPVTEPVPVKGVLEYFAAKYTHINRDRLRALLFYSELEYYKATNTRLTDTDYNAVIEGFIGGSVSEAFSDMQYEHDARTIYNTGSHTVRFTSIHSSREVNALPGAITAFLDSIHSTVKNTPTSTLTEYIENTPLYSLDYTDEPVDFSTL